ncbi:limulus clotting factor C-like isoform X2 [Centruroides vittatus]|uniref:limulus clotting factor C-like isoform X2 n=1 Tax=Centruroides vittatus TaxID=120091 RepID=UPI00350F5533
MSIFIFKIFATILLCSLVISDDFPYPKDAPTKIDDCRDVIFNCDCGSPGYKFQAVIKQCHFWNPPEAACARFSNCLECEDGVDRCVACPRGKYGRWCNGRCNCENGGTCNKEDGSCICPSGYQGERCEIRKVITTGELNCHTKASTLMKYGKNTQINVTCPHGCKEANGDVWGTSIYTEESSVCRAAIHAKVLNNNGGKATVVDNGIYPEFIGSNTEISSKSVSRKVKSFRFESFKEEGPERKREKCPANWIPNDSGCILFSSSVGAWKIVDNCIE